MISALLKGWWRDLAAAVEAGRLVLITSPAAIDEFLDVVGRPNLRSSLDPADAAEVANLLRRAALFVPEHVRAVCRDSNDDYLLALAVSGDADVLVTRDEDLLVLHRHGRTTIVHVADFMSRLARGD